MPRHEGLAMRPMLILRNCALAALLTPVAWAATEVEDPDWPREYVGENGGSLVMYQPQIESWDDFSAIEGRVRNCWESAENRRLGWRPGCRAR